MKVLLGLFFCFLLVNTDLLRAESDRFACKIPVSDSDWKTDSPASQGFHEGKLCLRLKEISESGENIHSVLVERSGKLVAEMYLKGRDRSMARNYGFRWPFSSAVPFDATQLHDQRSVSKSVVSLLLGIAIDKGKLKLDDPFLDSYPDLKGLSSQGREKIRIRHLLTMSAGLNWQEMRNGPLTSDELPLLWKKDLVSYYFDRELETVPGEKFNYSGGATSALADILTKIDGRNLLQIAQEDFFSPLGIYEWEWAETFRGIPMAYAGLRLKPRDMLKIGRLINQNGIWKGKSLVSASWVEDSIRPHVTTDINLMSVNGEVVEYGYQWWTGAFDRQGQKLRWSAAIGNGGQRIFVVPELDLTCVITAGDYGDPDIQKTVSKIFANLLDTLEK
ncbi:serine hydrolase domain-containing protein [Leptospira fletcheri]|nr:serine hydrolase [Leptospira fletcheri]